VVVRELRVTRSDRVKKAKGIRVQNSPGFAALPATIGSECMSGRRLADRGLAGPRVRADQVVEAKRRTRNRSKHLSVVASARGARGESVAFGGANERLRRHEIILKNNGPVGSRAVGGSGADRRSDAAALLGDHPVFNVGVVNGADLGGGVGNVIVSGLVVGSSELRNREGNVGRREVVNVERGVVEIEERLVLGVIKNMQP